MSQGTSAAWVAALVIVGCGDVETRLRLRAAHPDPFEGVRTVQVVAQGRDGLVALPEVRWDQGPQRLEGTIPLTARRVWVVGKDAQGVSLSAALSPPLDLVAEPPEVMTLDFARIGALSVMGEIEARSGWRALSMGAEGTLLVGGVTADGVAPASTVRIGPFGDRSVGPLLPGGGARIEASRVGREGVVWGEEGWRILGPLGFNADVPLPIGLGDRPALVASGRSKALAFGAGGVVELDLSNGQNTQVWLSSSTAAVAAAPYLAARAVTTSGAQLEVFNTSSGSVTSRVRLPSAREGAGLATTVAGTAVILGGGAPALSARFAPGGSGSALLTVLDRRERGPMRVWAAGPWLVGVPEAAGEGVVHHLLRGDIRAFSSPGPLRLAPHPDGTLRGVADRGAVLLFQPGPEIHAPGPAGAGWTPSVPGTFRAQDGEVVATSTRALDPRTPSTWAVLGVSEWSEVELDLSIAAGPDAIPSVLFGFDGERYDELMLGVLTRVRAGPTRPIVSCPPLDLPALGRPVEVRVGYNGARLTVDVGRDGSQEFRCARSGLTGRVALAVRDGEVRFRLIGIRGVP